MAMQKMAARGDPLLLKYLDEHREELPAVPVGLLAQGAHWELLLELFRTFPYLTNVRYSDGSDAVRHLLAAPTWVVRRFCRRHGVQDTPDSQGLGPVCAAVLAGRRDLFRTLLREGFRPDTGLFPCANVILANFEAELAAVSGWIRRGLKHGMSLHRADRFRGFHPLFWCCYFKRFDTFRFLVELGADPNFGGAHKRFCAVWAAQHKPALLQEYDFDLGVRDASGNSVLHTLLKSRRRVPERVFRALLRRSGLGLHDVNSRGESLFFLLTGSRQSFSSGVPWHSSMVVPPVAAPPPPVYSAFLDNLVIYVFLFWKKNRSRLYVPVKDKKVSLPVFDFDSEVVVRIKKRVSYKEKLSRRLDNFVEYSTPDVNYAPAVPQTLPKDKLVLYILTIVGEETNHSNLVLLDPVLGLLERFDPEGTEDHALDRWVQSVFGRPGLEWVPPVKGGTAYQLLEESLRDDRAGDPVGYCSAWCLWYAQLRVNHPAVHPHELYERSVFTLLGRTASARQTIRGFSTLLSAERDAWVRQVAGPGHENMNSFPEEAARRICAKIDEDLVQ